MEAEESASRALTSPNITTKNRSAVEISRSRAMDEETTPAPTQILPAGNFAKVNEVTRRLVVHSITLENFKSYQGKQVIGPFDDVSSVQPEIRRSHRPKRLGQVQSPGVSALHLRASSQQDEAETPQRADPQLCEPLQHRESHRQCGLQRDRRGSLPVNRGAMAKRKKSKTL